MMRIVCIYNVDCREVAFGCLLKKTGKRKEEGDGVVT